MKLLPIMMITSCTGLLSAQVSEPLRIKEHTLSNGMTVWLNEDHTQPKVFGAVVVKAGAKDSPDTGIPHYFEHIMFKGTEKIGTIDYEEEKKYLDQIEVKYDALAATSDPNERESIQLEINELSRKAAAFVIPNEFDRLISRYGGTRLNAGTSYDYTVYFNTFSPQYLEQWAELNSERLIDPVFRLFQSELETVYEEKNMYSDIMGSQAIERLTERYFHPHPYAYPILGSTENLKNPRLSEMRKFFDTYYVASNMGLILSGDFQTEEILPVLEKTFSRIKEGKAPANAPVELPPFKGREQIRIKFPVPVVKVMALGFRGVPANHKDQVALTIAVNLLNNSNGTGFLDQLVVDRKLLSSMALNESLNEAGILGLMAVPKLVFQSYGSAEKMLWDAIGRIKKGDFSDEIFQSLKLEQKREYASALEDINSRAQMMMKVYSQGKSWEEYVGSIACIEALTKEDIIAVAQKYFSDNYLHIKKKTGKYPKEHLPKPAYAPIVPQNRDSFSVYARELEKIPVREIAPYFIDFEKDVFSYIFHDKATLFVTPNPVNDIFTLNLSYGVGALERPELTLLASYLNYIGTQKHSFEDFRNQLQMFGSTVSFEVTDTDFHVKITGFDNHFRETIDLIREFLACPQADNKKIKQVIDEVKVMEKAFVKSNDNMVVALLEKVKYGEQSRYLTKWPLSRVKQLKGEDLLAVFHEIQKTACGLHYCGTLTPDEVKEVLSQTDIIRRIEKESHSPVYREPRTYDQPTVFFLDMPDLSQSIVYSYVKGDNRMDLAERHASKLFAGYFGGDMSSLMFQEIREFRSYAYRVSAQYYMPPYKKKEGSGEFITMLSTQGDKTLDAMAVLDSLIREMPERPERIEALKQTVYNHINNEYPSFRKLSSRIAGYQREGYAEDPNKTYLEDVNRMGMEDILRFYQEDIQGKPIVYVIVGNAKHIDMQKLAAYGKVVRLKKKDIYK
ncbi:M16 family metallopeptidase [Parabacteroides sp. PF5-6]|uniref:M16 family metallopeptidase n=1 Tax=Parabacteroides sp. PF5-6 TaxID=1742403 RepID=UPI002407214F|nr:M16 family metallopeptidase [Parabacteroides sp. PF5-6]MDF9828798.1 putative Zn-dependent peptidase [Parabacteroides sp. PF5-6]